MKYPPMNGVYLIENTVNGKLYVGQSGGKAGIEGRWRQEKCDLRSRKPDKKVWNRHLQASWDKHGEEAFEFVVLEIPFIEYNPFTDLSFNRQMGFELTRREQYWKDILQNAGYVLYNQKGPVEAPHRGRPLSPEHRLKLSLNHADFRGEKSANFGKKLSDETKRKISIGRKGIGHTQETKDRMRKSHTGFKHTEESKRKMSKVKSGENSGTNVLTWELVRKIRREYDGTKSHQKIALEYGVSRRLIGMIITNQRWKE